jgi:hypothetical protein
MRQRATWLVVAALVALGTAAAVDALRGGEARRERPASASGRPTSTTTADEPSSFVPLVPQDGLDGLLYYTDESCRLRALELPALRPADALAWSECTFSLSPGGDAVQPPWAAWSPTGTFAGEVRNRVELDSGSAFPGSAPAWRPDGTLTYLRGGALRAWPSRRVLLSSRDLRRAAVRHPNVPEAGGQIDYIRARQVGWLSSTRVVLILGVGVRTVGEFDVTAVFERRRLVTTLAAFQSFERLWTSPQGAFFALGNDRTIELYDRSGGSLPLPQLTGPHALAWSPDDSWLAVATRASIYLFRPGAADLRLERLPIFARDLGWRENGAPALGNTTEVSRWLDRAGARGVLYLSDADCRIHSLRMPKLGWTDGEVRAPCRFSVGPAGAVSDEWIVSQERGPYAAGCHANAVDVFTTGDRSLFHRGGACSPAWKPDGSLTYVAAGRLIVAPRFRAERTVVSRSDVAAEFGSAARLEEVGWLDDDTFAAIVRIGRRRVLAVQAAGRWRGRSHPFRRIEGLRVGAGMAAARTTNGITFFDGHADVVKTFPDAHAVAWSRGRIAAVAGRHRVYFVAPPSPRVRSLPVYAADLEWR